MYRFATKRENYEDFASGRVLFGKAGATNFPVRLASEIFQRCERYLKAEGRPGPYGLYDPLCGVAYSLTVLGLVHGESIKCLAGSDSNGDVLSVAKANLDLVSRSGLEKRLGDLSTRAESSGRDSHIEAVASAERILERRGASADISFEVFQGDALSPDAALPDTIQRFLEQIDMAILDLPYGTLTSWQVDEASTPPSTRLLATLKARLPSLGVVAIASDKGKRLPFEGYERIERFQLGKRQMVLLKPLT